MESVSTLCHYSGLRMCLVMFDLLEMVRTLIDVYGNTGFPGVEEPCGPWYSIFNGWTGIWMTCLHAKTVFPGVEEPSGVWYSISHGCKGVQMESISTIRQCSGLRKCVFVV